MRSAKLTPPRLFSAVARHRLFERIDAMRDDHSVLWVASPPGAGKTTLVASYLSHSRAASTWFQMDEGDADPATFFFFLGQTVSHLGQPLPYLSPELAEDLPQFARIFFREYFARLPERAVVVFDNAQEFDWTRLGHLLEIAFAEVPPGITLIVVSRDPPPARLARIELSGQLGSIGWGEIRLDSDEAERIAQLGEGGGQATEWLQKIDGWVAGVVMLREHVRKHGTTTPAAAASAIPASQEAVFRYFAGEILERMPPASQRILLLLADVPGVSAADAQELTGDPAAERLLSRLFHAGMFVDRRGQTPVTYQFHALFREFLQFEAAHRLDAEQRARVATKAACLMEAQGRIEDAARLYQAAQAHDQLAKLLLASASAMLATGRGQAWRNWLGALPIEARDREPLLRYWEGVSLNQTDPARARKVLGTAELAFQEKGDALHRALAIAAIIDSLFYEWADFRELPGWVDKLWESLQALHLDGLEPTPDVNIHSRLGLALCLVEPDSPRLGSAVQRVLQALARVPAPADRLVAGAFLLVYLNWGDAVTARELAFSLAPLADDPQIAPFHRIFWYRHVAFRHQFDGRLELAQATIDKAQALVTHYGLEQMQFQLHFRHGLNLLGMGRHREAEAVLAKMRPMLSPSRRLEVVYVRILESAYYAQTGASLSALEAARDAMQIGTDAKLAATTRWQISMLLAYCHALTGDPGAAQDWAIRAVGAAYGPEKDSAAQEADYLRAFLCAMQDDEGQAGEILRRLLRHQRERSVGFPLLLRVVPQVAQSLLAIALREGIEPEHVRQQIIDGPYRARSRMDPLWPWPIAIRAFGPVEILLGGQPLKSGGKTQKRPLMLARALLVAGETGKAQAELAVQLWPEVEDGKAALNVTVHRLRKLLGDDKAIRVSAGTLSIDPDHVWSDVFALGDVCAGIEALAPDAPPGDAARLGSLLQELYRGPLFADDDEPWILPARDAWRRRYLAAVARLGDFFEGRADWIGAEHMYRRGLEAEPLAEVNYRGLMRCAHARGDAGAAFGAYRRCREILSLMLGQPPSRTTEDLLVALGLSASAGNPQG